MEQIFYKALKWALIGLVALLVLALAVGLSWRMLVQLSASRSLQIEAPLGIQDEGFIEVGDQDQWIQIRGENRQAPIVLLLHGGPGASWLRATQTLKPWEAHFVVVQWEQRGTGRSYGLTGDAVGATMSIERMAQDGIEVAEYLTRTLGQDKVILLGHGWGALLGVHMAQQRPDLFHALAAAGAWVDLRSDLSDRYRETEQEALSRGDTEAQRHLLALGAPPYSQYADYLRFFQQEQRLFPERVPETPDIPYYGLAAPGYSLKDLYHLLRGMQLSPSILYPMIVNHDLRSAGLDFDIPVLFFQGLNDQQARAETVRAYYDAIEAPRKAFLEFQTGGHFQFLGDEEFLEVMRRELIPLAR